VTVSRLFAPRWLATGAAVVLAGVVGLALLLQNTGAPACAAPPSSARHRGTATFYDLGGSMGHCSFPSRPADDLFVALGDAEYAGAAACGTYLDVTGPKGTVRVKVFDSCPGCEPGHLDLSRTAFRRIADEVKGIVPITYRAVPDAPTPGPLSVRFKDHTSRWWFAVLVDNHANPLTSMRAKGASGGWLTAQRADYNYWIIEKGAGPGPFTIRITDWYGHAATLTHVRLLPEVTQPTSARLGGASGARAPAHAARPRPRPRQQPTGKASPAPSRSGPGTPLLEPVAEPPAPGPAVALAVPARPSCR
jgi:expansin